MLDRADLINQLAVSMGAGKLVQEKTQASRYDAKTGTLYCNGMQINASVAVKSIEYFEAIKQKCARKSDPASMQLVKIYECAIQSIKMMQNPKVRALLEDEVSIKQ